MLEQSILYGVFLSYISYLPLQKIGGSVCGYLSCITKTVLVFKRHVDTSNLSMSMSYSSIAEI